MPADDKKLAPAVVRRRLRDAANAASNDAAARDAVGQVLQAFAETATRIGGAALMEVWRAETEPLATGILNGDGAARRVAADQLASYYSAVVALSSGTVESRVGTLKTEAGSTNPALVRALEQWSAGTTVITPVINVPLPGGASRPCVPAAIRVVLDKPGALPGLVDAGLEPDFIEYLRENDMPALQSFAAWRAQHEDVPTDDQPNAYQVALAVAHRQFEADRFADRYCRPGDIAAPGVQYGHRLLRLPVQLSEQDFRNAGCGSQVYEGELGAPLPPELDYAELVRRYVNALRPEARWRADLNAVTRADIVESHLRYLPPGDPPVVLQFLVVASQTALQQRSMATFIAVFDELMRRGQSFTDWVMSPEGAEIRDGVLDAWHHLIGGTSSGPAAAVPAALAAGTLSVAEFARAFSGICVPPGPAAPALGANAPTVSDPRIVGLAAANFYPPAGAGARTLDQVRNEIDRVLRQYDLVWSQAAQILGPAGLRDASREIQLSGLEARAHIAYLAIAELLSSGPWQVGGPGPLQQILTAILDWLGAASVPIGYDDVVGQMADRPFTQPVQVGQRSFRVKDFWHLVAAVAGGLPAHQELSDPAYAAVLTVINSYAASLDVVVSASGAQAAAATGAPAAADPYRLREGDLPTLLQRWTRFFALLVSDQRKRREVVEESLLLLRLVPRRGRYGETPQRTAQEALEAEPKPTAWLGHPTRLTEGYVLEPMPSRYYVHSFPALYVREDYRIGLMPRGYGIGANLYSMSLLPQEEQTIVVKSFKDTRSTISESTAENVFEEAGSETSNDFANEVARENQQESSNQREFDASAKASASFLFASAELSTGYSSKDSARDFAKNVSNVTSKLAQKLSSKRTVAVETKREGEREEGTHAEISTERRVSNPNMGHTVTFHWFQMTRKFVHETRLEDAKLVYSSGKHNVLRILTSAAPPAELGRLPVAQAAAVPQVHATLPPDVASRLPRNAAVIIVGEPYTEVVPMSGANAFLARVFSRATAVNLNSLVWQHFGYFDAAPEGLGVLAYPGNRRADPDAGNFVPLFNPNPSQLGAAANPQHVVADRITVHRHGVADETFYLPNIDLRYRTADGVPPARYSGAPYEAYAVPRVMSVEERVVNTNGVFCEAMVGRCTALEDYLQRHRDLDLLDKRIQTGLKEIEFRFALARDGLVEIVEAQDRTVSAIVREPEGGSAFAERLAVEREQLAEQEQIASDRLGRRRVEAEVALLEARVAELTRRVALLGTPPAVRIDAPDGATVNVRADVDLRSDDQPPLGGTIAIE